MIKAIVKLTIIHPYIQSLFHVFDFISLWGCTLRSYKSHSNNVTIAIPSDKFKLLFGENPRKGKYKPPRGAEYFMEEAEVIEVEIK